MNWKRLTADAIIKPVHYASRLYGRLTGRRFGLRHHYYLMKFFRSLGKNYLVNFSYPNPLRPERALRWKLDLCQNTQGWIYRSRWHYEFPWIRAVDQALEEAEVFLDVGAHVGIFALTVGQARPDKKVIAVEALPSNGDVLENNIRLNRLKNVTLLRGAVAKESGKINFYANPINDGGGSVIPMAQYQTGGITVNAEDYQKRNAHFISSLEIPAYCLHDLVDKKTVLKIDAEGAELDILESGKEVFQRGLIDMVVIEILRETQVPIIQWFEREGFDCFHWGREKPVQAEEAMGPWKGSMGRILICLRKGSPSYKKVNRGGNENET